MKYLTSLVALAFCLLVGCSGETPVETPKAQAPVKTTDLGVIEVADGVEMLFALDGGKTCLITPSFQKEGTVVLQMIVEKNGEVLSRPRIQTPFDMPVSISVGDISVALTARKKP